MEVAVYLISDECRTSASVALPLLLVLLLCIDMSPTDSLASGLLCDLLAGAAAGGATSTSEIIKLHQMYSPGNQARCCWRLLGRAGVGWSSPSSYDLASLFVCISRPTAGQA